MLDVLRATASAFNSNYVNSITAYCFFTNCVMLPHVSPAMIEATFKLSCLDHKAVDLVLANKLQKQSCLPVRHLRATAHPRLWHGSVTYMIVRDINNKARCTGGHTRLC